MKSDENLENLKCVSHMFIAINRQTATGNISTFTLPAEERKKKKEKSYCKWNGRGNFVGGS